MYLCTNMLMYLCINHAQFIYLSSQTCYDFCGCPFQSTIYKKFTIGFDKLNP